MLVRVKIQRPVFQGLRREDVADVALDAIYRLYYQRGATGKELVVGPVGRNSVHGRRIPDKRLPRQYKFEGSGVAKLVFDAIIVIG